MCPVLLTRVIMKIDLLFGKFIITIGITYGNIAGDFNEKKHQKF